MTVYGFRHLSRLRESNARIHRLSADVETYERNKFYLRELEDEYTQLQIQLCDAKERWNTLYVPAMEKRQALLQELDFARNYPEEYYAKMRDSLRGETSESLRSHIVVLQRPKLRDVSLQLPEETPPSVEETSDSRASSGILSSKKGGAIGDVVNSHDDMKLGTARLGSCKRPYRSWNLADASKRVDELETVRSQIKSEMGSIGAQTCALTVKLTKIESEVASLCNAMSLPPEHLYAGLERELLQYKLEGLRQLIQEHEQPSQKPTPNRARSGVTSNSSKSLSLAYSIGTASTGISTIGLDFLKSAESSLAEIEAKFL